MARLSKEKQEKVKNAIQENDYKTNQQIAEEQDVPVKAVAALRVGMKKKMEFSRIEAEKRGRIRKFIKLGKSDEDISQSEKVSVEDVKMINREISTSRDNLLTKKGMLNSLDGDCKENISMNKLGEIFKETAQELIKDPYKSGYLLYRRDSKLGYCPRECEVQHIISYLLSKHKYYHMIESPTLEAGTIGRVDVSIFNSKRVRLVDIELKEKQSYAENDFPKLLSSSASGSAVLFISNKKSNLEILKKEIILTYKDVYNRINNEIESSHIHKKWFIFFLLFYNFKRAFMSFYEDIRQVDFEKKFDYEIYLSKKYLSNP